MLSFEEIKQNLHTPCLLLDKKKRKSLHDMTKTSNEKLMTQTYKVFRREDHDFFENQSEYGRASLYQTNGDEDNPFLYVTIRRNKILYNG